MQSIKLTTSLARQAIRCLIIITPIIMTIYHIIKEERNYIALPYTLTITSIYSLVLYFLYDSLEKHLFQISFKQWYQLNSDSYEAACKNVHNVVTTDPILSNEDSYPETIEINNSPLPSHPKIKYHSTKFKPSNYIVFSICVSTFMASTVYTSNLLISSIVGSRTSEDINSSLFIYAAVIIALYYAYELKIKSTIANRMIWINELREEMSRFFSVVGLQHLSKDDTYVTEITRKKHNYNKITPGEITQNEISRFQLMSKLELMMNPSEVHHRALLTLMRLCLHRGDLRIDHILYIKI